MKDYSFSVELNEVFENIEDLDKRLDEIANKLYESCDSILVGASNGVISIDFDYKAESYNEAVTLAVSDLIKAGIHINNIKNIINCEG